MEELDDQKSAFEFAFPPALVSLTSLTPSVSPSPRRLFSWFTQGSKPLRAKRQLPWVSLLGRLVGAEETTSAKTIVRNGAFSAEEATAWELFTPIQRVLVVAVVAAAAIGSKKNKQIFKLQKSVEFRDQVLQSMQQKLDGLCQQMNYFNDQPEVLTAVDISVLRRMDCGCQPCQHHNLPQNHALESSFAKGSKGDEVFKYKMPAANVVEPEERRMSDLSDWPPSVTSSIDNQLETRAVEHNACGLQKECEQKDATTHQLSGFIQSSETYGSKRIAELEDIIRKKNTMINKLRKDMMILEHKVMNLTRAQRPSSLAASSNVKQVPLMIDNIVYDMDSTTSPSDSDSPPRDQMRSQSFKSQENSVQIYKKASKGGQKCGQFKSLKFIEQQQKTCATSPLKERSPNQTPNSVPAIKPRHNSGWENRTRRRPPAKSEEITVPKRWL